MAAVLRDSSFYSDLYTSKYPGDARKRGGRLVPFPFEVTAVTPATIGDTYNCIVIPANYRVVDLAVTTTANTATITVQLGDSGNAVRYMPATVFATVDTIFTGVPSAGAGYVPTADTIVVLLFGVAAPTVGAKVTGIFHLIPPA